MMNSLKMILLVIVLISFKNDVAYSKQFDVSTFESGLIGKHMEYLESKNDQVALSDIMDGYDINSFKASSSDIFNFGYTSSAYWLRVSLYTNTPKTLIFEIDNAMIDHVAFFEQTATGWQKQIGGDMNDFSKRSINYRLNAFKINLKKNTTSTFYFYIQTRGAFKVPIKLFTVQKYVEHVSNFQLFYGAVFGILLAMSLYNLLIYIKVKDPTYLFYVFFLVTFLLWSMSFQGEGYRLLWRFVPAWFASKANNHFLPIMSLSATLFIISFLNTKASNKPIHYTLVLFSIGFSLLIVASFFVDTLRTTIVAFMSAQAFFIISCIYLWGKSNKQARYYILSWVFAGFSGIILILYQLDIIKNQYSPLSLYIGMVFGVVFLSTVIGSRLNEIIKELIDKNAMLVKAIEIKDDVLANTSHELKTPLNGIIGLTQSIIEKSSSRVSSVMGDLLLIKRSSGRLLRLINDILDLVKIKNGDMTLRPVSLEFADFFSTIRRYYDFDLKTKGLHLITNIEKGLRVKADVERLTQIMDNLVSNAIKYTLQGSISISAAEKGDVIEIRVSDTGIGIADDMQSKVFERYETGVQQGTGLGLNITKTLVELHGGSLGYSSEINKGTSFYFTLPVAQSTSSKNPSLQLENGNRTTETSPLKTKPHSKGNKTIFLVDDDRTNLAVLINFLEGHYNLIPIASGEELFKKLEKQKPDLILLDIMMPNIDGYKVCQQIRKVHNKAQLPIIFQSAKSDESDMREGFQVGGNDYICKPIQKIELLSRIENCLSTIEISRIPPKSVLKIYKHLDDIVYLKSAKDYVEVFSYVNGKPLLFLKMTLKSIIDFCPGFIQVNRSTVINTDHLQEIKKREMIFKNTFKEPVSIKTTATFSKNLKGLIAGS